MKKESILFWVLTLIVGLQVNAQTINNVPINTIENKYIEVIANFNQPNIMSGFTIDLGHTNRIFTARDLQIRDQNGMVLKFTSVVDLLNFFAKNGYDLFQTYALPSGNQSVCHYVLKRNR